MTISVLRALNRCGRILEGATLEIKFTNIEFRIFNSRLQSLKKVVLGIDI